MGKFRSYIEDIMYGRRQSVLLSCLLLPLSWFYLLAVRVRRSLYRRGILKRYRLPCRVISIGNITVGGTGKTPMTIQVAERLLSSGQRPCVVSRGYGRRDESVTRVVSDGRGNILDSKDGGDEPVLIAHRLPQLPIVVGADRVEAARTAIQQFNPDVIILDDGFQHLRLCRDLDIVLLDASSPFGNRRLLPAGILREPIDVLTQASAIVITRAESASQLDLLMQTVRSLSASPQFTSIMIPHELYELNTGRVIPLSEVSGRRIALFSGIARPMVFRATLEKLGAVIVHETVFPDHHVYAPSEIQSLLESAKAASSDILVTTEKDAARLTNFACPMIWGLRIECAVFEEAAWRQFIADTGGAEHGACAPQEP